MTASVDDFLRLRPEDVPSLEYVRIATPYVALPALVGGFRIADVGCGPGYGSFLTWLGEPELIVTCDVDDIRLPVERQPGVTSSLTDACNLALRRTGFDMALMFEVIEHVDRPSDALRELARVTRDEGVALVSTPNRAVRLLPFEPPWNEEHLREWTPKVFRRHLAQHFDAIEMLGVYGEPALHQVFLDDWRPSLTRLYRRSARPILAKLVSDRVVRGVTDQARRITRRAAPPPARRETPTREMSVDISSLDPAAWPFFLAPVTPSCLSVVAVCGRDATRTRSVARSIVEAFGARTPAAARQR